MSAQTDLRFASQTFQQLVAMCPVSLSTDAINYEFISLLHAKVNFYIYISRQIKTEIRAVRTHLYHEIGLAYNN